MYMLNNLDAKPSPVFDMESCFWTILFVVLLHREHDLQDQWEKRVWTRLKPEFRSYAEDFDAKKLIINDFGRDDRIDEDWVLFPIAKLLTNLAKLVSHYDGISDSKKFVSFSEEDEMEAIDKYIACVEEFLESTRN